MPIEVDCPKCGKKHRVPDSAAGKTGRCSACKAPITIPATSTPRPSSPAPAAPFAPHPLASAPTPPRPSPGAGRLHNQLEAIALMINAQRAPMQALLQRGWERIASGDTKGLVEDVEALIRMDPHDPAVCKFLGSALSMMRRPREAIPWWTRAFDLGVNDAVCWGSRAECRMEIEDYDGALADFDHALEVDPRCAPAVKGRGLAHHKKGDNEAAIRDWRFAIQCDASYSDPLDSWIKEAMELVRQFARFAPADRQRVARAYALVGRGWECAEANDLNGALASLSEAVRIAPELSEAWRRRGRVRRKMGDLDGAMSDFKRAKGTSSVGSEDHRRAAEMVSDLCFERASICHEAGDEAGEFANLNEAIVHDPTKHYLFWNRSMLHGKKRDKERAIADLRKALELAPADWNQRGYAEEWLERLKSIAE